MSKCKSEIKNLQAFEGPNVIHPDWPKPPSKVKGVAMRVGEILTRPSRALDAVDDPVQESMANTWRPDLVSATPQTGARRSGDLELQVVGLWAKATVLTESDREKLLARALEDPTMPEAWQKEAFRQLEESENSAHHGEA